MKYLTKVTEVYRVDTEPEVARMIDDAKNSPQYILSKYSSQAKEKKAKGEIVDSWFEVTLIKLFNDPKEPTDEVNIIYE